MSNNLWEEILSGVPHDSILGSVLFNIFASNVFSVLSNTVFATYADNNTPQTAFQFPYQQDM